MRATSLSIVAPCFNEQEVLPEFLRRVRAVVENLGMAIEIVLVDDGSRDATWPIIAAAASDDTRILGIRLRRNHGHQTALSAGLAAARGELLLLIDADLQDPPELLPAMIELMQSSGADVVYGQRRQRSGETAFKKVTASAFYRCIRWLSEIDIPSDTGDFRLITRSVADVLVSMPEHHRFLRGMVAWIGGRQVPLIYDRDARHAGSTKYPLRRMLRFASDAITGFSRRPLQVATATGILAALFSLCFGLYSVFGWAFGATVPGWTSLTAAIGFLSALQFVMLGIIGEYLGRLYEESRRRPLFLEAGRIGRGLAADEPPSVGSTPRTVQAAD
jgi:polyisoprenyl-phosphate glycosyltransferase